MAVAGKKLLAKGLSFGLRAEPTHGPVWVVSIIILDVYLLQVVPKLSAQHLSWV
jgi:hypothetical protein